MTVKQKKISLPTAELTKAKEQAEKDGFGTNITGWVRWIIRKNCSKDTNTKAITVEA